jgi:hypothetical protein
MKSKIWMLLPVFLGAACAGKQLTPPKAETELAQRYSESVLLAASSSRSNKWHLSECISNWGDERKILLNSISEATSNSALPILIVEVGGTGFGRHRYVLAEDGRVTTRQGTRAIDSLLAERIKSFAMPPEQSVWQSNAIDANCYFLTTAKNGVFKTSATYDVDLSSESGRLIRDLLELE